jgi:hypothetical protein
MALTSRTSQHCFVSLAKTLQAATEPRSLAGVRNATSVQYPLKTFLSCKTTTGPPQSASELYRPSNRCSSAKLVPTFADRGCHVVSVTDPSCRILGFLDRTRYCFFQIAPQLDSRGSVDAVPDPLLLRKSESAGKRTRTSGSVASNSDH